MVRVREFETEGTGLHFSDMGMSKEQMPTLDVRFWFNDVNALHFRFRYFNIGGTRFSSIPIAFNGAIIPGGRTNNFEPSPASPPEGYVNSWRELQPKFARQLFHRCDWRAS
jgi:hypothetical protein